MEKHINECEPGDLPDQISNAVYIDGEVANVRMFYYKHGQKNWRVILPIADINEPAEGLNGTSRYNITRMDPGNVRYNIETMQPTVP